METSGRASQEYLKLVDYLRVQNDGATLEYSAIARDTGVKMNMKGKAKLREAVKLVEKRYDIIRGVGIVLDSPQNTPMISSTSVKRIGSSITRARKTHDVLARHVESLDPQDQEIFRFRQTVLVTIDTEMVRIAPSSANKTISISIPVLPSNV